jgi:signal peptidase complex subunit 3
MGTRLCGHGNDMLFFRKEIFNRYTRTQNDHVDLKLKLDANFTEIFDWNVREIFVFVVASYKTRRHVVNEVVLWDKIIRRGDPSVINLPSTVVEYHLLDHGKGLVGNDNVTLKLCWNVIPIAGQLPLIRAAPSHVIIPSVYS